jgi:hypothetical protein
MNLLLLILDAIKKFLAAYRQVQGPAVSTPTKPRQTYLTDAQIAKIRELRPDYEFAVNKVKGFPWQVMAALHYREAEFAKTSKIPGGAFQLDPGGTGTDLRAAIDNYANKVCDNYGVPHGNIETDFNISCLVAAFEFKTKIRFPGEDGIADAFWGYNGRAKFHTPSGDPADPAGNSWHYSSYVSNDPKNGIVLNIRGTMPTPDGKGRVQINKPDPRPGALIIFREVCERIA